MNRQVKKQSIAALLFAAGIVAISFASCVGPLLPKKQVTYIDGTYTGTGEGMMGPITVEVVVSSGAITNITLKEHKETEGIYEKAETWVVGAILENQTTDVDSVSGATYTSEGIKAAVADALKNAVA